MIYTDSYTYMPELNTPRLRLRRLTMRDAEDIFRYSRDAEVGYSLARSFWNHGVMTEALRAVIAHGFGSMNLNRIEAQHETTNPASGAVMRKCHMQHEGTLRSRLFNKGRYVDVELYAILRKDYNRTGMRRI